MLQIQCTPPEGFIGSLIEVVPQLHTLECKKERQDIAFAAALVLDALAKTRLDESQVEKVRRRAKQRKHGAAMAKRKKILKQLHQKPVDIDLGESDEEEGFACLVCRETAKHRPADVLGIYAFARRVEVLTNAVPNEPTCSFSSLEAPKRLGCYTSVTHLNAIHHACHKEAAQIDAAMRPPKREWDGATVRNLKTRCNCILPIMTEYTSQAQYARSCAAFVERVSGSRRRGQLRMYEQCVYNMRMLIARMCWGHSYSADTSGGGADHNLSALPVLLQLSLHALDQEGAAHERSRAASLVEQFVAGAATPFLFHLELPPSPNITAEFIMYVVTSTLQVMSIKDWRAHKYVIVRNLVAYLLSTYAGKGYRSRPVQLLYGEVAPVPASAAPAPVPASHSILSGLLQGRLYEAEDDEDAIEWLHLTGTADSRSDGGASTTTFVPRALDEEEGLTAFLRPFLVYVAIIDELHTAFKAPDADVSDEALYTTDTSASPWVGSLGNRLAVQLPALIDRMKCLRQNVADHLLQASLPHLCDVLGILPDVLGEAPSPFKWATQFLG
eukprot:TRINITY_DN612_c1_g2_i3.p1 TRINITY_DN612_c1_g2~~TRINITY_DN612_c1_g2_i3.p1  ORF type:complete len:556 (+),score=119.10 TRINITY_DN612_c1_g2_i3:345-2012(+)